MDKLDFPGVALTCTAEVLVVYSQQPLTVLSSAVVRGCYLLNRRVHRDYRCLDPVADLVAFARRQYGAGNYGIITESMCGRSDAGRLADRTLCAYGVGRSFGTRLRKDLAT
jgi:hypothetical protein